ncbi:MAG: hypothetical protein JWM25_802, partial [Thermoleophilia bacterium]|nr:hypothetical protein [Thermoleophilia bacterium]
TLGMPTGAYPGIAFQPIDQTALTTPYAATRPAPIVIPMDPKHDVTFGDGEPYTLHTTAFLFAPLGVVIFDQQLSRPGGVGMATHDLARFVREEVDGRMAGSDVLVARAIKGWRALEGATATRGSAERQRERRFRNAAEDPALMLELRRDALTDPDTPLTRLGGADEILGLIEATRPYLQEEGTQRCYPYSNVRLGFDIDESLADRGSDVLLALGRQQVIVDGDVGDMDAVVAATHDGIRMRSTGWVTT